MTGRAKARIWAVAGLVPAILVSTWVTGPTVPDAGALLVMAALGWGWVCAVLAEHAWQQPTVRWLERRNLALEEQLAATEAAMKAVARARSDHDTVVVDLRRTGSTELRRRVEASRLHAEPTDAELAQAKRDITAAFEPYDLDADR